MTIRRKMVEKTKLSIAASFLYAFAIKLALIRASLVAQMVKICLQCRRHTYNARDTSLGQKDPLEERMATHSSILGLENPLDRGAWQAAVYGISESDMTE